MRTKSFQQTENENIITILTRKHAIRYFVLLRIMILLSLNSTYHKKLLNFHKVPRQEYLLVLHN